jgi:hypothetical protein
MKYSVPQGCFAVWKRPSHPYDCTMSTVLENEPAIETMPREHAEGAALVEVALRVTSPVP